MITDLIIPVLDEESALPDVLKAVPKELVRRVVVVDNGSKDRSASVARSLGAEVVTEPRRGYGRALWTGVEHLMPDPPDSVVFLDGDAADDPAELSKLLAPLESGAADLVIGSRMAGRVEKGAMQPIQKLGNRIVPALLRIVYGASATDLGPFRAILWSSLLDLGVEDRGFGFTVEMQINAAKQGLRVVEVPVTYRKRVGRSKISGTFAGSTKAGLKILWIVFRHAWKRP